MRLQKLDTVLVTGGCGFIGSNFIHGLLKRYPEKKIINVDSLTYAGNKENLNLIENNENYKFEECDIASAQNLEKVFKRHDIDAVVHFAAESHVDRSIENPNIFINTNIYGTYNLLNLALKKNSEIIFLHVSTDEVYGSLEIDESPFKESNQYMPNSPYSASKASSDHLVRAWHHTYNLKTLTTNCSNNYGPYQFPEKLIPSIIFKSLKGEPITIYGEGLAIRDWLYVDDHCEAIEAVLDRGKFGETYNIGGGFERTNIDLTSKICFLLDEILPSSLKHEFRGSKALEISSYEELITFVDERPGHDQRYAIDASKIQGDLKWHPKETLDSGLKKTVEWYVNNLDWLSKLLEK